MREREREMNSLPQLLPQYFQSSYNVAAEAISTVLFLLFQAFHHSAKCTVTFCKMLQLALPQGEMAKSTSPRWNVVAVLQTPRFLREIKGVLTRQLAFPSAREMCQWDRSRAGGTIRVQHQGNDISTPSNTEMAQRWGKGMQFNATSSFCTGVTEWQPQNSRRAAKEDCNALAELCNRSLHSTCLCLNRVTSPYLPWLPNSSPT